MHSICACSDATCEDGGVVCYTHADLQCARRHVGTPPLRSMRIELVRVRIRHRDYMILCADTLLLLCVCKTRYPTRSDRTMFVNVYYIGCGFTNACIRYCACFVERQCIGWRLIGSGLVDVAILFVSVVC